MKIIRAKTSKVVKFFFPDQADIALTEHGLTGERPVLDVTPANYELVTGVSITGFLPVEGALTYDNGWAMYNQDIYDAELLVMASNLNHPIIKGITATVIAGAQKHLDDFAQTKFYDGILSACTYAFSAVPQFQLEGEYALLKRDETWAVLYGILLDAQAGLRGIPTSFEELIPELPELVWPSI